MKGLVLDACMHGDLLLEKFGSHGDVESGHGMGWDFFISKKAS